MIEFNDVTFSYDNNVIFESISFTIPDHGLLILTGPSGCGKTTLLRLISGLERPVNGKILMSPDILVSYDFQEPRLFPWMNAKKNVESVVSSPDRSSIADMWLTRVELSGDAGKFPDELSGGMLKRVALARAFAYGGDVLLLDEPFGGIDTALRLRIMPHVREYAAEHLVIMTTHDEAEAQEYADMRICLSTPSNRDIIIK